MLERLPKIPFCRSPTLSFMPDELLVEQWGQLFLVTSLREDMYPLHQDAISVDRQSKANSSLQENPVIRIARRLLFSLLRLATRLHSLGIVHNDICLHTVFADTDPNLEDVYLGGFSEASEDMSQSKTDYYQVFQTVKDYLGPLTNELPSSWLGHDALDHAWSRLDDPVVTWPFDPAATLNLNPDRSDELWTTIAIKRKFDI